MTDLNRAALEWCNGQNTAYHRALGFIPQELYFTSCAANLSPLNDDFSLRSYQVPGREISFDGFINYEGRFFGMPYSYRGSTARIAREVTWSKRVRFCKGQYLDAPQPEEFPTAPVKTSMTCWRNPSKTRPLTSLTST